MLLFGTVKTYRTKKWTCEWTTWKYSREKQKVSWNIFSLDVAASGYCPMTFPFTIISSANYQNLTHPWSWQLDIMDEEFGSYISQILLRWFYVPLFGNVLGSSILLFCSVSVVPLVCLWVQCNTSSIFEGKKNRKIYDTD